MSTSDQTKRLIYFVGHKKEKKSAMITRVCKNYETVSTLHEGEFASRTLSNLYNLHAVRGSLNSDGKLVFDSSMSGPHHYFGFIDPTAAHTIEFCKDRAYPVYRECANTIPRPPNKQTLPDYKTVLVEQYKWHRGIDDAMKQKYNIQSEPTTFINTETSELVTDSLFDNPGVLELETERLTFPIVTDGYKYDLSQFKAQIVPNNEPFMFDQDSVSAYKHAQHKLRVVTYNYGSNYVDDYLMKGSGIFIERHEFIQAITPINAHCGGYVILGRVAKDGLVLMAVTIPFGYTLLVDVGAIHGDSMLTGMYMMAMTGNHNAMKTADTVFMKHSSGRNVACTKMSPVPTMRGNQFLLTSDQLSLTELKALDRLEKDKIAESLTTVEKVYWQSVILTGTPLIGWTKTLGIHLP